VDEDENRLTRGSSRLQLPLRARPRLLVRLRRRSPLHRLPAVDPRLPFQSLLDGPHQGLRSEPGNTQFDGLGTPAACQLAELRPRVADDRVVAGADRQREDPADQAADEIGGEPARRRAVSTQPVEQDLALAAEQIGTTAGQRGLQLAGAGDQDAAVGQFDDEDLVRLHLELLADGGGAARRRAELEAGARLQVTRRHERIIAGIGGAPDVAQQCRQGRLLLRRGGQIENGGRRHLVLLRARRARRMNPERAGCCGRQSRQG